MSEIGRLLDIKIYTLNISTSKDENVSLIELINKLELPDDSLMKIMCSIEVCLAEIIKSNITKL